MIGTGSAKPCKLWTGTKTKAGYGQVYVNGQRLYVHRWAWEKANGPIPAGHQIDHTCHNEDPSCLGGSGCRHRACFEDSHLEAVSQQLNIARGKGHGSETHCPRNHPYDEANTYWRPDGAGRGCRACIAAKDRARPPRRYDPAQRRATYLRKKARA